MLCSSRLPLLLSSSSSSCPPPPPPPSRLRAPPASLIGSGALGSVGGARSWSSRGCWWNFGAASHGRCSELQWRELQWSCLLLMGPAGLRVILQTSAGMLDSMVNALAMVIVWSRLIRLRRTQPVQLWSRLLRLRRARRNHRCSLEDPLLSFMYPGAVLGAPRGRHRFVHWYVCARRWRCGLVEG